MKDKERTKEQLINELVELRQWVAQLETSGTIHKQAEEALRESEQEYRTMIEQSNDMIWTLDTEGDLTFFNKRCEELAGHRLEDWRGKSFVPLVVEEDLPLVMDVFHRTLNGEPQHYEVRVKKHDGDILILSVNTAPILKAGQVVGTVSFGRNVTERKRLEHEIEERRLYLESVLACAPDAIVTLDAHHNVLEWNLGAERLFGYTPKEVVGRNLDSLITGSDTNTFEEATGLTRRILAGGSVPATEVVRYRKDGSPVDVIASGSPILVRDEVVGVVTVYTDITERKRAEEERARLLAQIREQAQQVQQIIDTMPEGVLLLDADGQVILANPVAEGDLAVLADAQMGDTLTHLGGRSLEELLTSPPKGLWHEVTTDSRRFEVIARPLGTGPTPLRAEPTRLSSSQAQDETGGWVLVIRDVTREREVQQRAQQQDRLAVVGQLAAGIAHDFNNIMATIILYAQMASRAEGLSARDRERLAMINQQAKHATNLIQQILDFSRRAVLEQQPLDLSPLLKEHVKLLERTLPENIEIKLVYGRDEYTVYADPTRMQQVMMNLGLNARDAMPEGGSLRFGLERVPTLPPGLRPSPPQAEGTEGGEWVQVTVSDTGTGIPPDVLPHIFDPFFTTKAPGEGSGLGLAQVHGIVKQHGGEIGVKSQAGQGTTFTIYLPALPVHPAEAVNRELPPLAKGQGETVLVVEDDRATREALVDSLELLNYRVLAAANGREALAILERQTSEVSEDFRSLGVALVLSDVVMPRMGGIKLLQALKERGLVVRVVMLTGHQLGKELEELRAQGMSDWLPKPPSLEQLAEVVARALNL